MANPLLRRYSLINASIDTWIAVGTAPITGRALAISKVVISNQAAGPAVAFAFAIGASGGGANNLNWNTVLGSGQVYTETNLVALAGEQVWLRVIGGATNTVAISVFGEEVDNT